MQQRVGLAQALINNPDLLILDEPTSGLDPLGRMKVREIIQRLKNEGKTVFFSSHELGEVETVCDRVAIIHQGELKAVGRVSDFIGTARQPRKGLSGHHRLSTRNPRHEQHFCRRRRRHQGTVSPQGFLRPVHPHRRSSAWSWPRSTFSTTTKIVRYLKEICLLLIWISSLVIAITTTARQIPAEREHRTLLPLLAKPLTPDAVDFREIPRLLARLRPGAALLLRLLRRARRQPRTSLAAAELFPGRVSALGHARRGHRAHAARLAGFRRALLQRHDLLRRRRGHFVRRPTPRHRSRCSCPNRSAPLFTRFILPFRIWNSVRHAESDRPRLAARSAGILSASTPFMRWLTRPSFWSPPAWFSAARPSIEP